ncbi:MAG: exodeoxyribonuclease VII small subunit [Thermomicrobiales bacterium]
MDNRDGFDSALARWESALASGGFEEVFQALGESVSCLESGGLPLERSLRCFELGARLAEQCDRMLAEAELRVSRLDEVFARLGGLGDPSNDEDANEYDK